MTKTIATVSYDTITNEFTIKTATDTWVDNDPMFIGRDIQSLCEEA